MINKNMLGVPLANRTRSDWGNNIYKSFNCNIHEKFTRPAVARVETQETCYVVLLV